MMDSSNSNSSSLGSSADADLYMHHHVNAQAFVNSLTNADLSAVLSCNPQYADETELNLSQNFSALRVLGWYGLTPTDDRFVRTWSARRGLGDAIRAALVVRMEAIFDWPFPSIVRDRAGLPTLALSQTVIAGLVEAIYQYLSSWELPPMAVEMGDRERISRATIASGETPPSWVHEDFHIQHMKRLGWVGSRLRVRLNPKNRLMDAMAKEFYPSPVERWKTPALAAAGVLTTLGVVGGAVLYSRSRSKKKPLKVHGPAARVAKGHRRGGHFR